MVGTHEENSCSWGTLQGGLAAYEMTLTLQLVRNLMPMRDLTSITMEHARGTSRTRGTSTQMNNVRNLTHVGNLIHTPRIT